MLIHMLVIIVCSGNRIWGAGMCVPASQGACTPHQGLSGIKHSATRHCMLKCIEYHALWLHTYLVRITHNCFYPALLHTVMCITHQKSLGMLALANVYVLAALMFCLLTYRAGTWVVKLLSVLQLAGLRVVGLLSLAHNPVCSRTIVQMWWIEKTTLTHFTSLLPLMLYHCSS